MIPRILQKNILEQAFQGQVLIIQGPRQVGKATLAFADCPESESQGFSS